MPLKNLAIIFIGVVLLAIVAYVTFLAWVAGLVVDEVEEKGAKQIIERIWEGPTAEDDTLEE